MIGRDDLVLGAILRRFLTGEHMYAQVFADSERVELVLDGTISISALEQEIVTRILAGGVTALNEKEG